MSLLLLILTVSAHAEFSCYSSEGILLSCDGPAECQKFYPMCEAKKEIANPACEKVRCRGVVPNPDAPAKPKALVDPKPIPPSPPEPKPNPAPPPKKASPPPAPRTAKELHDLVNKKLEEARELVREYHAKPPVAPPKKLSGLTPEAEAKLFGTKPEPPPPPGTARTWSFYMTDQQHRKLVDDLTYDKKLRYELQLRVSSTGADAPPEEREANALVTNLIGEADKKAGESGKGLDDLKPLNAEDVFDLDDGQKP